MKWLFSKRIDLIGMYIPFALVWIAISCAPTGYLDLDFPLWAWVLFVLGLDVSHVWSTVFRTYLDKDEFQNHKMVLLLAPIILFLTAFAFAFISIDAFWRMLAYLAVFHFIKQQYGFLALYRLRSGVKLLKFDRILDKLIIYLATGLPILIWHFSPDPSFNWFVYDDFIFLNKSQELYVGMKVVCSTLFAIVFTYWLIRNLRIKNSLGAVLWVTFTILNWFGGIVFLESDIVFTITNIVGHGIPYLLLITFYKSEKERLQNRKNAFLKWILIISFAAILLAIIEEFFWDTLLNHEKSNFFEHFTPYFEYFSGSKSVEALLLAILVLPQLWHYFIDGIIWKANEKNPYLKKIFKPADHVK